MLGSLIYQNEQGISRNVSFTEVIFNRKYVNFIDDISGGTFVFGLRTEEKHKSFHQYIYLNLLTAFHNNMPYDIRYLQNSMADEVVLKELEYSRDKPLTTHLSGLMREVNQTTSDFPIFLSIQESGIYNIKTVVPTAEGVVFETKTALVTLKFIVSDTHRLFKPDIIHFIYYYLTMAISNSRTKDIIDLEFLTSLVRERFNMPVEFSVTRQKIK